MTDQFRGHRGRAAQPHAAGPSGGQAFAGAVSAVRGFSRWAVVNGGVGYGDLG